MSTTTTTVPPSADYAGTPRNGVGLAALLVGVVSLVLAVLIIFAPLSFLLGIIAVILGIVGISRANKGVATNKGQAMGGLVTGILSLLVAIAVGISLIGFFVDHQDDLRKFGTCMSAADNDRQRAPCVRELSNRIED